MEKQLQNKSSLKQKIFLILLGLLISALLAEILFRIGGVIANKTMIEPAKSVQNAEVSVICIGDSSTYGLEASDPDKYSYPAQLQALLDEKVDDRKFNVLNLGVPGMNSSQVLHRFRENLLKYKPDIAIVMIGINDPWNLEENSRLQGYNEKNIYGRFFSDFQLLLNKSKIYQFFKIIYVSSTFQEQKINIPGFNAKTKEQGFTYSKEDIARSSALYNSISNNLIEIKQIAEQQHVALIFMKYHNSGWGGPEIVINESYANLNVPVVDQLSIFTKAKALGFNVRGKDGWHPNDFGYSLMARNIFNKMVELKIIESEAVEVFPSRLSEIEDIAFVIGDGIGFYDWETWSGGKIPEWPDNFSVKFRWTQARASISVNDRSDKGMTLFLFAANPDINKTPLKVRITGDSGFIRQEIFTESKWRKVVLKRDEIKGSKILTLQADRTWNPKAAGVSNDSRDLGIIVAIPE